MGRRTGEVVLLDWTAKYAKNTKEDWGGDDCRAAGRGSHTQRPSDLACMIRSNVSFRKSWFFAAGTTGGCGVSPQSEWDEKEMCKASPVVVPLTFLSLLILMLPRRCRATLRSTLDVPCSMFADQGNEARDNE